MIRIIERIVRGERVEHYETRRRAKSGEILNVSLTVSPVLDETGEIIGASKIARDIGSQKRAQEVLRKNEKLAVIGRMAASIAHEINNPLEAVTNLLYLLEDHTLDAEGAQYLADAQRELARVAAIAARTLSFHRNAIQPAYAQAARILDETLDFNRPRLVLGHIEVCKRYRTAPRILCLEGELRQVFMNLVGNAAEAMPAGGRLSVRVRSGTDPKTGAAMVRVTIADTGVGMDRITLARLFEPFYTTKGSAGTGLGLWISEEIVRKHQGRVQVRSCQTEGRAGTVFVVHLPKEPSFVQ
jgi:signal transduction histidine kinase